MTMVTVPLILLLGTALTGLSFKSASANGGSEKNAVIDRIVAYLKGKHVDMKEDNLVSVKMERLDGPYDLFGCLVEIGNDENKASTLQELLKMMERLGKIRSSARLGEFESVQEPVDLSLPGGGPNVVPDFVIEDDQPRGVALIVDRQIEQGSGRKARIVHLAYFARGIVHRIACIEQDRELAVGFSPIPLQISALGAGKNIPVHMAKIVAW
jgi:hypothetical protein